MRLSRSSFMVSVVGMGAGFALLWHGLAAEASASENAKGQDGSTAAGVKAAANPKSTMDSKPAAEAAAKGGGEPKPVSGPRLTIDKPTIDVGNVVRGQLAVAVFEVRNTGDQALTILDARPGCGCTVASFDKTIPAGGTGKVTANVKTDNFRGPIEKSVSVTSSDTSNATVSLHVKANVTGSVEVLPSAYLSFPNPLMEYSGKLLVRQDKTESGELQITDVTTSAPWMTAKARKVTSPEVAAQGLPAAVPGDWVLDVSATEDVPPQGGGYQLTFKTGLRREPQVTIPVSLSLVQAMQARPPSLIMVIPHGTPTAKGSFTVAMKPGLAKETVTARAEPNVFDVTIEHEADRRYKATVVWKTSADPSQREGSVVVSAGAEHLSVPVRVIEKPAAAEAPASAPGPQPASAPAVEPASHDRTP